MVKVTARAFKPIWDKHSRDLEILHEPSNRSETSIQEISGNTSTPKNCQSYDKNEFLQTKNLGGFDTLKWPQTKNLPKFNSKINFNNLNFWGKNSPRNGLFTGSKIKVCFKISKFDLKQGIVTFFMTFFKVKNTSKLLQSYVKLGNFT